MPNLTWTTTVSGDDVWFRLFTEDASTQASYCPECGAREGMEHALVHVGQTLPCGGWRRPCSLSNTLPMEE